ncbi:MAG: Flp pilus assembly complex ATPase component TadA, partial [Parcubacteria group bacterium]|nr:Flp pilus assembly complex ATPase component TadA [Parcubacteria group bacterium]
PYIDLSTAALSSDALRLIKEDEARAGLLAPFRLVGKKVHIAIAAPENQDTKDRIKELENAGYSPTIYVASKRSLARAWERYGELSLSLQTEEGVLDVSSEQVLAYLGEFKNLNDVTRVIAGVLGGKERYQTTRILEILIAGALATDASDIHIEPEEARVILRYRLDGVLQELSSVEERVYTLLLSRIKILSGMKLNVRDDAQSGRFTIKVNEVDIEVRTSTVPGAYGESVVLRILNPKAIAVPFDKLGMEKRLEEIVRKEIKKPNGLILNTGPTGSGKTTTLYAILRLLNDPSVKIITIEDPVEYHLPGITQTQVDVDTAYNFFEGLRSGLRQDPDVIMVGEIRDKETAETAINAALTGHLVLSSLHTNNAAGTIPRLIDLSINPKIIGSALTLALAQRLIRKLCEYCKKEDAPTEEERGIIARMEQKLLAAFEGLQTTRVWRANACEKCNNTGYKGRIGIFEAMHMNAEIEKLAAENPSEREIKKLMDKQGLLDMGEDGVSKILLGVTSFEEVRRVIDLGSNTT